MTDLGYAPHIPGRMATLMQANCEATSVNDQSIVCKAITSRCNKFTYTCANQAVVSYGCTDFAKYGGTVLDAEPPEVRAQMAQQANNGDYKSRLATSIQNNCSSAAQAQQAISANIQCTDSASVVVNVLNTMDATSACATLMTATIVADARAALVSGQIPKPPPVTNIVFIALVLGACLFIGVAIMLAIWKS